MKAFRGITIARRVGRFYLADKFGTLEVGAVGRNALGQFQRISGEERVTRIIDTNVENIAIAAGATTALSMDPTLLDAAKEYAIGLVPVWNSFHAIGGAIDACR